MFFGGEFADAGADFISLSRGGKFDDAKQPGVGDAVYPYTGPSGYECMPQYISDERGPFGRNAAPTAAIRQAVRDAGSRAPVVCAGGIHNFEMAEDYLARGVCDIVGAARQSLADPDWFLQDAARFGRSGARLRIHQLLRRPRPEAQAGHLPALGQGAVRTRRTPRPRRQAPPHRAGVATAGVGSPSSAHANDPVIVGDLLAATGCSDFAEHDRFDDQNLLEWRGVEQKSTLQKVLIQQLKFKRL